MPSTEVVASLINFALLNYNWRTLGLFGKRLPHASETRRENPIPRRPKTAGLMLEESQAKFSERFERLKNTDPAELIKAAEKTANSIAAHGQRGGTANSERGQQLIDRYEELREAILATERGVNAWNEWCKKRGYYAGHDAYDFFA